MCRVGRIVTAWDHYRTYQQEQELVLSNIERRGIPLDVVRCAEASEQLTIEIEALQKQLPEINWNSPQQKAALLYDEWKLPIPPVEGSVYPNFAPKAIKWVKGDKRSTSAVSLVWLISEVRDKQTTAHLWNVLKLQKLSRDRQFADKLPQHRQPDGRIHCGLAAAAETGRSTCKLPNLQQQPPSIRRAFVAPKGKVFLIFDYDALEWRVLAHVLEKMYGDTSLSDDIRNDVDPHGATAVGLFDLDCTPNEVKALHKAKRDQAKTINYGLNYGKTEFSLGAELTDDDGNPIGTKGARALLDKFYATRPGIARFHEDIKKYAHEHGYVRSLLGRFRLLPDINHKNKWIRRANERRAQNVIQNCATDVVTMAMLKTDRTRNAKLDKLDCDLTLLVHDELIFEVPEENAEEAAAEIRYQMEHPFEGVRDFLCPLGVSGGLAKDWGVGH